jgi:transposase
MRLTDKQWEAISAFVPEAVRRSDGKGRPSLERRAVLDGILWILQTGARWQDLPSSYPSYQTCHRRFQQWEREGIMRRIVEALARDLQERGGVDLSECFIDGSFSMAKKGALLWARLNEEKAPRSWQSQTLRVLFFLSQSKAPLLTK